MSTEGHWITVGDLTVEVVRKPIKNLHLGVYPPDGRVRVAAPPALDDEAVRLAVIGRMGWITRQRARFAAQPRQSQREMVSGESHYFEGRRYRLRVHEHDGPGRIALRGTATLHLYVRPGTTRAQREALLHLWYREHLKLLIPPLLARWQALLQVEITTWGIRRMKTKWGSCNISARRLCVNLELAKKPPQCLEYILVHELMHLRERHHNQHFRALMDTYLPTWPTLRDELNRWPLGHDEWGEGTPSPPRGAP